MVFILTIDTEADNQWDHGRQITVENIKFVPRFQKLCQKYMIKPTYLVTSEVCEDKFAKEIFSKYISNNHAEIGAHLHTWTTPPFKDSEGYRYNDVNHAFATELPQDLLNEKIRNLTIQIKRSFGMRPLSFRSGRFGFNDNLATILIENDYLVDSSITPYTSWSCHQGIPGNTGGPDFRHMHPFPYFYNLPIGSLFEIPITILPTKFPIDRNKTIAKYYFNLVEKSFFLRAINRIIFQNQPLWLRPYPWMNINLFEELINKALEIKLPFLVMMFHSSELMPGCSIYRKDKESVEKLFYLLEQFFVLLRNKKITSNGLTEAVRNYSI